MNTAPTIQKLKRVCLFCGQAHQPKTVSTKATATDEDIVPRWLQKYLGIENEIVTPMLVRSKDLAPLHIRQHVVSAFKAGGVCSGCNGGWMSDLENAAKPILIALIEGTRFFPDLAQGERYTIARWTMKTVAALNRSSTYANRDDEIARRVPDEHLRCLAAGNLPPEVLVVGTIHTDFNKRFDFLQFARWGNPKNSIPLQEEHRNRSYKIALSFGQLILIVAYYPSDDYAYAINQKGCFPIWSNRRVVPFNHIWDDSESRSLSPRLEVPLRNIWVVSHTWQRLVDNMAFTRFIRP
jgi:hypothetical protein